MIAATISRIPTPIIPNTWIAEVKPVRQACSPKIEGSWARPAARIDQGRRERRITNGETYLPAATNIILHPAGKTRSKSRRPGLGQEFLLLQEYPAQNPPACEES